jgi:hypothetical protein
MSNLLTLPIPELDDVPVEVEHTTTVGSTRFTCIQDDCDGTHHFWCSCGASAHAC